MDGPLSRSKFPVQVRAYDGATKTNLDGLIFKIPQ